LKDYWYQLKINCLYNFFRSIDWTTNIFSKLSYVVTRRRVASYNICIPAILSNANTKYSASLPHDLKTSKKYTYFKKTWRKKIVDSRMTDEGYKTERNCGISIMMKTAFNSIRNNTDINVISLLWISLILGNTMCSSLGKFIEYTTTHWPFRSYNLHRLPSIYYFLRQSFFKWVYTSNNTT